MKCLPRKPRGGAFPRSIIFIACERKALPKSITSHNAKEKLFREADLRILRN